MNADDSRVQAAVSELANALQVAAPVAVRMRQRLDVQAEDADALAAALARAVHAMRQLQPVTGREGA